MEEVTTITPDGLAARGQTHFASSYLLAFCPRRLDSGLRAAEKERGG
jgi:hypothetical protein